MTRESETERLCGIRAARTMLTVTFLLMVSIIALAQDPRWTDQFGSNGFDVIYALDDDRGDVYGAGEVGGRFADQPWAGRCDAVVRKYTGRGSVQWTRQFGTEGCDIAEGIAVGGSAVYVGGSVEGALAEQTHQGAQDAYVRKYDEDGNELWTRQFGGPGFDHVAGAAATDEGVFVVGQTFVPNGGAGNAFHGFIRKYDGSGTLQWVREFSTSGPVMANEVDVGADGVVIVGRAAGPLPGQEHAGGRDVFVRKYDLDGNELWTRQFGTVGNDIAWGVDVAGGAIYVSGDVAGALPDQMFFGGSADAFVRKYDAHGNELWTRQFGTGGFDRAIRVAADDAKLVVVGRVGGALPGQTFAGGATDPFSRMYDPAGNEGWTVQFGSAVEPEAATGVVLDGEDEDIFVSGGIGGALSGKTSAGFIDAFVIKLLSR